MPLPEDFAANTEAKSSNLRQLLRWFRGDPNQGLRALLTNTNEDDYIFDMANQHQNGKAVRVSKSDGTEIFHAHAGANGEPAVVASPDGTTAQAVVTTGHAQTLINKTLQSPLYTGRPGASIGSDITVGAAGSQVIDLGTSGLGSIHTVRKAAAISTATLVSVAHNPTLNGTEIEFRFVETGITVKNNSVFHLNGDFTSTVGSSLRLRLDTVTTPSTPYWYELGRTGGSATGLLYARLTMSANQTVTPSSVNMTYGTDTIISWRKDVSTHDRDTSGYNAGVSGSPVTTIVAPSVGLYMMGITLGIKPSSGNTTSIGADHIMRIVIESTTGSGDYLAYHQEVINFSVSTIAAQTNLFHNVRWTGLVVIETVARQTFRVSTALTSVTGASASGHQHDIVAAINNESGSHFWIQRLGDL